MSKITNDGLTRSGRERMLYSCTHMATVGAKGLMCAKHLTVTDGQLSNGSMPQLTRIIPENKNIKKNLNRKAEEQLLSPVSGLLINRRQSFNCLLKSSS